MAHVTPFQGHMTHVSRLACKSSLRGAALVCCIVFCGVVLVYCQQLLACDLLYPLLYCCNTCGVINVQQ